MSSLDAKNTSHLVKNTPVSSSIKNDCARGSYHWVTVRCLSWVDITLEATTWVPVVLATDSSWNSCLFSILAFLTEIIVSWTVSRVPEEINPSSTIEDASFWLLFWLLTKVNTLFPDSNLGFVLLFGSGIKKLPIRVALISEINLTSDTVAWAPLVCPTNIIPDSTKPENAPSGWFDREKVSTFNIVEVDEYVEETDCPVYGLTVNLVVGEL